MPGAFRAPHAARGPPAGPGRGVGMTGAPSAATTLEHVLSSRSPGLSSARGWRPYTRDPKSGRGKGADWTRRGGRRGARGAGPRISAPGALGHLTTLVSPLNLASAWEVLPLPAYDWSARARRGYWRIHFNQSPEGLPQGSLGDVVQGPTQSVLPEPKTVRLRRLGASPSPISGSVAFVASPSLSRGAKWALVSTCCGVQSGEFGVKTKF